MTTSLGRAGVPRGSGAGRQPCRFFIALLLLAGVAALAQTPNPDRLRAERVGWARLKTTSEWWRRHAESDQILMRFFREQTTLNIDPTWYAADVEKLEEMCGYPFLFAQSLEPVRSQNGVRNVGEYLRRGGFMIIDACINAEVRGDYDLYILNQKRVLTEAVPDIGFDEIRDDHELLRCFFQMPNGVPHTAPNSVWSHGVMIGAYRGTRLVAVINTSGLQCGWAGWGHSSHHLEACMKMLVNIYIYAMMQGGGEP